jgi:DNA-binding LytR/AlgR family response regulator
MGQASRLSLDIRLPFENLKFEGFFDNTSRAREFLLIHQIDLLFLDIEMPGDDGLSFMKRLDLDLMVVFVTSKSKYALAAFDFNPIHFLTKPLDKEKLIEAVRRVFAKAKTSINQDRSPSFLIVKDKGAYLKLLFSEISYIEAAADYMVIFTGYRSYFLYTTMKELAAMLPDQLFSRVHRSFIVNRSYITKIEKGQVIVSGKSTADTTCWRYV